MGKSIQQKLKERIKEHGQTYKIDQLCLDELLLGQFSPQINKLLEKCINLQYLTLQNCQLYNLQNLPRFPKLSTLELDNNKISEQNIAFIAAKYPNLKSLSLRNNQLKSLNQLAYLSACKNLQKLLLSSNPITTSKASPSNGFQQSQDSNTLKYTGTVFSLVPSLTIVDYFDKNGKKLEQQVQQDILSQSEGEYSEEQASEQEVDSPQKMRKKN